jgi:hypothetical protein
VEAGQFEQHNKKQEGHNAFLDHSSSIKVEAYLSDLQGD